MVAVPVVKVLVCVNVVEDAVVLLLLEVLVCVVVVYVVVVVRVEVIVVAVLLAVLVVVYVLVVVRSRLMKVKSTLLQPNSQYIFHCFAFGGELDVKELKRA